MFAAFDQYCELRAAVQRQGEDQVALFYELRNKADAPVFVFHGVTPKDSPYYLERATKTLVVSQKIVAPPPGLELERPEVPLAARVGPGERFRQKIELTVPLHESVPYPHLLPPHERQANYLLLETWLEVGYFAGPDETVAREAGAGFVLPGLTAAKQSILRAGPIGRFAFDPSRR